MANADKQTTKKGRTRSPAYPSFDLETAIEKIRMAYEANDRHPMAAESLASYLKYTPTSSSFLQAISTLKQYGLLDDTGWGEKRRLQVSGTALDILLSQDDSPKKAVAIKQAALNPAIHAEIWRKYNGSLPPKDDSIRFYLLREREAGVFNRSQVDAVIAELRVTIAFAKLEAGDKIDQSDIGGDQEEGGIAERLGLGLDKWVFGQQQAGAASKSTPAGSSKVGKGNQIMRDLPITLPSLQVAVIRVPFPMTEADYLTVENAFKGFKSALVEDHQTPALADDDEHASEASDV